MAKDASLFSSLDSTLEKKIYVVDDFGFDIDGHAEVTCRCGQIIDMFHVYCISINQLSISQLTQTNKIVELWPNHFFIKDLWKNKLIVANGVFDPKDWLYKFYNLPSLES